MASRARLTTRVRSALSSSNDPELAEALALSFLEASAARGSPGLTSLSAQKAPKRGRASPETSSAAMGGEPSQSTAAPSAQVAGVPVPKRSRDDRATSSDTMVAAAANNNNNNSSKGGNSAAAPRAKAGGKKAGKRTAAAVATPADNNSLRTMFSRATAAASSSTVATELTIDRGSRASVSFADEAAPTLEPGSRGVTPKESTPRLRGHRGSGGGGGSAAVAVAASALATPIALQQSLAALATPGAMLLDSGPRRSRSRDAGVVQSSSRPAAAVAQDNGSGGNLRRNSITSMTPVQHSGVSSMGSLSFFDSTPFSGAARVTRSGKRAPVPTHHTFAAADEAAAASAASFSSAFSSSIAYHPSSAVGGSHVPPLALSKSSCSPSNASGQHHAAAASRPMRRRSSLVPMTTTAESHSGAAATAASAFPASAAPTSVGDTPLFGSSDVAPLELRNAPAPARSAAACSSNTLLDAAQSDQGGDATSLSTSTAVASKKRRLSAAGARPLGTTMLPDPSDQLAHTGSDFAPQLTSARTRKTRGTTASSSSSSSSSSAAAVPLAPLFAPMASLMLQSGGGKSSFNSGLSEGVTGLSDGVTPSPILQCTGFSIDSQGDTLTHADADAQAQPTAAAGVASAPFVDDPQPQQALPLPPPPQQQQTVAVALSESQIVPGDTCEEEGCSQPLSAAAAAAAAVGRYGDAEGGVVAVAMNESQICPGDLPCSAPPPSYVETAASAVDDVHGDGGEGDHQHDDFHAVSHHRSTTTSSGGGLCSLELGTGGQSTAVPFNESQLGMYDECQSIAGGDSESRVIDISSDSLPDYFNSRALLHTNSMSIPLPTLGSSSSSAAVEAEALPHNAEVEGDWVPPPAAAAAASLAVDEESTDCNAAAAEAHVGVSNDNSCSSENFLGDAVADDAHFAGQYVSGAESQVGLYDQVQMEEEEELAVDVFPGVSGVLPSTGYIDAPPSIGGDVVLLRLGDEAAEAAAAAAEAAAAAVTAFSATGSSGVCDVAMTESQLGTFDVCDVAMTESQLGTFDVCDVAMTESQLCIGEEEVAAASRLEASTLSSSSSSAASGEPLYHGLTTIVDRVVNPSSLDSSLGVMNEDTAAAAAAGSSSSGDEIASSADIFPVSRAPLPQSDSSSSSDFIAVPSSAHFNPSSASLAAAVSAAAATIAATASVSAADLLTEDHSAFFFPSAPSTFRVFVAQQASNDPCEDRWFVVRDDVLTTGSDAFTAAAATVAPSPLSIGHPASVFRSSSAAAAVAAAACPPTSSRMRTALDAYPAPLSLSRSSSTASEHVPSRSHPEGGPHHHHQQQHQQQQQQSEGGVLFGVADGHGGPRMAEWVQTHLPRLIFKNTRNCNTAASIAQGMQHAYEECDKKFAAEVVMKEVREHKEREEYLKQMKASLNPGTLQQQLQLQRLQQQHLQQQQRKSAKMAGACAIAVLVRRVGEDWLSFTANVGDTRSVHVQARFGGDSTAPSIHGSTSGAAADAAASVPPRAQGAAAAADDADRYASAASNALSRVVVRDRTRTRGDAGESFAAAASFTARDKREFQLHAPPAAATGPGFLPSGSPALPLSSAFCTELNSFIAGTALVMEDQLGKLGRTSSSNGAAAAAAAASSSSICNCDCKESSSVSSSSSSRFGAAPSTPSLSAAPAVLPPLPAAPVTAHTRALVLQHFSTLASEAQAGAASAGPAYPSRGSDSSSSVHLHTAAAAAVHNSRRKRSAFGYDDYDEDIGEEEAGSEDDACHTLPASGLSYPLLSQLSARSGFTARSSPDGTADFLMRRLLSFGANSAEVAASAFSLARYASTAYSFGAAGSVESSVQHPHLLLSALPQSTDHSAEELSETLAVLHRSSDPAAVRFTVLWHTAHLPQGREHEPDVSAKMAMNDLAKRYRVRRPPAADNPKASMFEAMHHRKGRVVAPDRQQSVSAYANNLVASFTEDGCGHPKGGAASASAAAFATPRIGAVSHHNKKDGRRALRVAGSLMSTRALGDGYLKNTDHTALGLNPYAQYAPYISGTPEVRVRILSTADRFLIIGSDGVWENVSNALAATLVAGFIADESVAVQATQQHALAQQQAQAQCDHGRCGACGGINSAQQQTQQQLLPQRSIPDWAQPTAPPLLPPQHPASVSRIQSIVPVHATMEGLGAGTNAFTRASGGGGSSTAAGAAAAVSSSSFSASRRNVPPSPFHAAVYSSSSLSVGLPALHSSSLSALGPLDASLCVGHGGQSAAGPAATASSAAATAPLVASSPIRDLTDAFLGDPAQRLAGYCLLRSRITTDNTRAAKAALNNFASGGGVTPLLQHISAMLSLPTGGERRLTHDDITAMVVLLPWHSFVHSDEAAAARAPAVLEGAQRFYTASAQECNPLEGVFDADDVLEASRESGRLPPASVATIRRDIAIATYRGRPAATAAAEGGGMPMSLQPVTGEKHREELYQRAPQLPQVAQQQLPQVAQQQQQQRGCGLELSSSAATSASEDVGGMSRSRGLNTAAAASYTSALQITLSGAAVVASAAAAAAASVAFDSTAALLPTLPSTAATMTAAAFGAAARANSRAAQETDASATQAATRGESASNSRAALMRDTSDRAASALSSQIRAANRTAAPPHAARADEDDDIDDEEDESVVVQLKSSAAKALSATAAPASSAAAAAAAPSSSGCVDGPPVLPAPPHAHSSQMGSQLPLSTSSQNAPSSQQQQQQWLQHGGNKRGTLLSFFSKSAIVAPALREPGGSLINLKPAGGGTKLQLQPPKPPPSCPALPRSS